jgi:hypothetical protein
MDLFRDKGANFDNDRRYRFALWRIWEYGKPMAMVIGLNPSTANEEKDDPTIRRLSSLLFNQGFGGMYMMNLFTYITAYPAELKKCSDANRMSIYWLGVVSKKSSSVIFAWGSFKEAKEQASGVIKLFPDALCFGKNNDGSPKHPLYLKKDTQLINF